MSFVLFVSPVYYQLLLHSLSAHFTTDLSFLTTNLMKMVEHILLTYATELQR